MNYWTEESLRPAREVFRDQMQITRITRNTLKPGMSKTSFVVDKDNIGDSRDHVNMIPNIKSPDSKESSGKLRCKQRQRSHSDSDLDAIDETKAWNENNVKFVVENDEDENDTDYVCMRPINKQACKLSKTKSWTSFEEKNIPTNAGHYLDRHEIRSESNAVFNEHFEEGKKSIVAFAVENDDGEDTSGYVCMKPIGHNQTTKLHNKRPYLIRQKSRSESDADFIDHIEAANEQNTSYEVDTTCFMSMQSNTHEESTELSDCRRCSGKIESADQPKDTSKPVEGSNQHPEARDDPNLPFIEVDEFGYMCLKADIIKESTVLPDKRPTVPPREPTDLDDKRRVLCKRHGMYPQRSRSESDVASMQTDIIRESKDLPDKRPAVPHRESTEFLDKRPAVPPRESTDFPDKRPAVPPREYTDLSVKRPAVPREPTLSDERPAVPPRESTDLPDKRRILRKRHGMYHQRSHSESDVAFIENKLSRDDPKESASGQGRVSSFPDNFDVANRTDTVGDSSTVSDTQTAETSLNRAGQSGKRIYLPNLHTKMLKFLLSSPDHRQSLIKHMARKGFDIVWPETEEGILYLEPSDSAVSSDGSNIHESVIRPFFYSRLRHYFILDDSICVAEEIYDDLTALLAVTPLVTTCTLYIENMTWIIIGDKRSVEECKTQLKTLIKFLEMRMRAKGINTITKTMFLDKYAYLVLEGKLVDRSYIETLGVGINFDSEHVKCRGENQAVEIIMQNLHSFVQRIEASVYERSPLVMKLLDNMKVKDSLKKLLKGRGLLSTWKIVDGICIVYGTSSKIIQSVKEILTRRLVSEVIKLTDGQTEVMHSEIGKTEIEYATKRYKGFLEVETSDKFIEIACTMEIQAEVRKLFQEFLNRHEVIKTIHEVDIGLLKLLRMHYPDKLTDVQRRCKTMNVEVRTFHEKEKSGFLLNGRRESCLEATRELENVLEAITKFEFTIKQQVGHVSFLRSKEGLSQIATFESKHQCIVNFANDRPHSQNYDSQTTEWVFRYDNTELIVQHDDIRTVTTGLAYIPCLSAADQIKSRTDVEIPYQLEAGECMTYLTPGQKQAKRYNFFACLPSTEPFASASRDVVKTSVNLCLQETTARDISAVAFSISNPIEPIYPAEYAEILLETIKEFLTTEKSKTLLKRVLFCTKDEVYAKQFTQDLRCVFGETAVRASASDIMKDICLSETDANGSEIQTEADKHKRDTLEGSEKKDDLSTVKPSYLRRKRSNDNVMPKEDADVSTIREISATNTKATYRLSSVELSVNVEVLMGDITKEATDVIVNSVHWNLDLSATVLGKAVLKEGGSRIQTELKTKGNQTSIRREGIDGIIVTGPGKLNCKYIFHVLLQGSVNGWKGVISSCLQLAEKLRVTSVAFPALGTGRNGIKAQDFTKAILKCIKTFSTTNPTCLRDIRIVVFDEAMLNTVIQSASSLKDRKTQVYDVVQSPTQREEEVRLQVYTSVDNVDCVKRYLAELCNVAVPELIDFYEALSVET